MGRQHWPKGVTEVQRLSVRPGDALVVKVNDRITREIAERIQDQVRRSLGSGFEETPILIVDASATLTTVGAEAQADSEVPS